MKVSIFKYLSVWFAMAVAMCSCNLTPENPNPENIGADYFPLKTGNYIDYQITENIYTVTNTVIVNNYQLREQVADTFRDINGKIAYRMEIYTRANTSATWRLDSIFVSKLNPAQAIKTESNISYVKLAFPLIENQKWDGNVYNDKGKQEYTLKDLGIQNKINTFVFDKTVKVIQANDSSLVNLKKISEIYAQSVGLIYRESRVLEYCSSTPSCIGKGQINYGRIYIQKIINYGTK